jgi:Flp pilus assembly protein TadD
VATLGLAWVAAIAATVALATEVKLDDSREAVRRGELDQAASDAAAARALSPWAGVPRLQLALVRERRGDLDGARRAAGEAADRDGEDWRVWLVVARLALRDEDVPGARRALRRARTLNPRSPIFRAPGP